MTGQRAPRILLGITGSIAAYKSAELCRLLIKAGCEVRCVMTAAAGEFISPPFLPSAKPGWFGVVCPRNVEQSCRVGLMGWPHGHSSSHRQHPGKMVNGLADNLLTYTYLSAKCRLCWLPPWTSTCGTIHLPKKISGKPKVMATCCYLWLRRTSQWSLTGEGRMAETGRYPWKHHHFQKEARPERQKKCSSPQDLRMSIWIPLGL